jgi:arylsulfatase A-like enzyme
VIDRLRVRRGPTRWALALTVSLPALGCAAPPAPPDLVLISLDTLRADHLSLYGYARATSPRLDRFAEDCRVFERAISSSNWTLPSHATMLTGLLPAEHRLTTPRRRLPAAATTVAETLAAAGYATSAVTDGGFLAPEWGLERGFESYSATEGRAWHPKDARPIFESAAAELDRLRAGGRPFLLFVHSYEVHQPYLGREGFAAPFLDPDYDGPLGHRAGSSSWWPEPPPAADVRRMIDLYDGEIRRLDHYLADFLARAAAGRGGRDLWVLITSDHGEAFGEHGTFEHGNGRVFEENVHVPMLLCGPGSATAARSTVPASTLDVTPTLLDLAGVRPALPLLGRSLRTLEDGARRWTIAHGVHDDPERGEEWLRVEGDGGRLLVDVGRGAVVDEAGDGDAARARALAALARGGGNDRLVLLPRGTPRVEWPRDAGFTVAGALDDVRWRRFEPAAGELALALAPGARTLLLVDGLAAVAGGSPGLSLHGHRLLAARLAAGVEHRLPFEGDAALEGIGLAGGFRAPVEPARPGAERERELRALGYL